MCQYISDNLSKKMPLDGPLCRIYYQSYTPTDYDKNQLKDEGKPKMIMCWKSHDAFLDGVSSIALTLQMAEDYDMSYFLKFSDLTWPQRFFTRISMFFYVPYLFKNSLFSKKDNNIFTKARGSQLSGITNCVPREPLPLNEVKAMTKKFSSKLSFFHWSSIYQVLFVYILLSISFVKSIPARTLCFKLVALFYR